jgi:hypothetical protein
MTVAAIGREAPHIPLLAIGDEVAASVRSIVGFSAVIRHLLITPDGRIAGTTAALQAAKRRWATAYGPHSYLPADAHDAMSTFARRWSKIGLPELDVVEPLLAEFRNAGLVV